MMIFRKVFVKMTCNFCLLFASFDCLAQTAANTPIDQKCAVLFVVGRNFSPKDPDANELFNHFNFANGYFVRKELENLGYRVVWAFYDVEETIDSDRIFREVLTMSYKENCPLLITASVFVGHGGPGPKMFIELKSNEIKQFAPDNQSSDRRLVVGPTLATVDESTSLNQSDLSETVVDDVAAKLVSRLQLNGGLPPGTTRD